MNRYLVAIFAVVLVAVLAGVGFFLLSSNKKTSATDKPWSKVVEELIELEDKQSTYSNETTSDLEGNTELKLSDFTKEVFKISIDPANKLLKNYDCDSIENSSDKKDCKNLQEYFARLIELKPDLIKAFGDYTLGESLEAFEKIGEDESVLEFGEITSKIENILKGAADCTGEGCE